MHPNMTGTAVVAVMLAAIIVIAEVAGAGAEAAAAPQLLQSQHVRAARFGPEARAGYAAGYGYGGVRVPVAVQSAAAVGGSVHLHRRCQRRHQRQRCYADAPPAVVGCVPSAVCKPDLSACACGASPLVEQLRRFDPVVRPVQTVVPKVTAVEPSVTVQKTYVDVPILHHHADHRLTYAAAGPAVVVQADYASPYYNYQVVDR
uniref:ACYPI009505 protein n=1 Tax=Acyrthosiphon pisum TaxID=7029 RepID=C4WXQ9_ACYPI|nr:ACYPI009505 [Acyrthosiphon pisum]